MAYNIHTTRTLILGGSASGTSSRYLILLTEQFGLIRAVAKSIREERSKLRPALSEYLLSSVSLVRGKDVWRITGAKEERNFFCELSGNRKNIELLARINMLLKRLLTGEEANQYLFTSVVEGLSTLSRKQLSDESRSNIECILVLRILYALGYLAAENSLTQFFQSTTIDEQILTKISPIRIQVIKEINRSLTESQL